MQIVYPLAMKDVLICTSDPMLRKALWASIAEGGYAVETVEYLAEAVRRVMFGSFGAAIIDSDSIGLDARDAAAIIKNISGETEVVIMGRGPLESAADHALEKPVDVERLKGVLRGVFREKNNRPS